MLTGCPIRKSAGQGIFAPNRGLSQLITSFIASVSLGIRHAPFHTFLVGGISHKGYTATHTFSCFSLYSIKENVSLYLSFTLQFRVSICQRSLRLDLYFKVLAVCESYGVEPDVSRGGVPSGVLPLNHESYMINRCP